MFTELNQRPPFNRDKTIGFRCVKYLPDTSLDQFSKPYVEVTRDYKKEKPVDDKVFAVLKTFYDYEKKNLNIRKELVVDLGDAIREKITFNAAYGNEKIITYIFTPKNIQPPYQTIVYFPGSGPQYFTSSENWLDRIFGRYGGFLVLSGRAFVYPIYKGTFERGGGPEVEAISEIKYANGEFNMSRTSAERSITWRPAATLISTRLRISVPVGEGESGPS
jgi:hypothetical protein